MINTFIRFFFVAIGAMFFQNFLLLHGFGAERILIKQSPQQVLRLGGTLTLVTVFSGILFWLINPILISLPLARYLRALTFVLCILVTYLIISFLGRKFSGKWFLPLGKNLTISASSCVVLGALLVASNNNMNLWNTIAMGLGANIGYVLALLVVTEGRDRLALLDVPKLFRGLPITLLYLGLLSLAICGLMGHQLPM